jgi:thioredoxin domain-containing protein 5
MKQYFLLVILFYGFCYASDVIELTDANFVHDTQIGQGMTTGTWFIEFFAPWCGHCKKLAPVWEEVATELKGKVNIAKVDSTVHKSTAQRFGIRGYPTLLLFRGDKYVKYSGARTKEKLVEFALSESTQVTDAIPPPASVTQDAIPDNKDKSQSQSQSQSKKSTTKQPQQKNIVITTLENVIKIFEQYTLASIIILLFGISIGFLIGLMFGTSTSTTPPPPSFTTRKDIPTTATTTSTTSNTMNNHVTGGAMDQNEENQEPKKSETAKKDE